MNHNGIDNWFSWVLGVAGGVIHYNFLQVHINVSDWIALGRSCIFAAACGFAGMAGKAAYNKFFKTKTTKDE